MSTAAPKRYVKTAKYRTFNLTPEHQERFQRLIDQTGINGNALFRLFVDTITPVDVEALRKRLS
jgi:hypothetical protein